MYLEYHNVMFADKMGCKVVVNESRAFKESPFLQRTGQTKYAIAQVQDKGSIVTYLRAPLASDGDGDGYEAKRAERVVFMPTGLIDHIPNPIEGFYNDVYSWIHCDTKTFPLTKNGLYPFKQVMTCCARLGRDFHPGPYKDTWASWWCLACDQIIHGRAEKPVASCLVSPAPCKFILIYKRDYLGYQDMPQGEREALGLE